MMMIYGWELVWSEKGMRAGKELRPWLTADGRALGSSENTKKVCLFNYF